MGISIYLLTGAVLLLISIYSSKLTEKFGIPALLLFLAIGMLVGSDGLNIIYFDDYELAQTLAIIALIYILFSGGLDTKWEDVRPIVGTGLLLSTISVLISALIVGFVATLILGVSLLEGMLLGAIISSTDAAAVFSVLGTNKIGLKHHLKELIEFESGTNDPMAIFLTVGLIQLLIIPETGLLDVSWLFLQQMGIGLIGGFILGRFAIWVFNHINLSYDGLYPVLALTIVPFIYAATDLLGGSGFLAVYIAGLLMGNVTLVHQKSLMNFFDGLGWLMQICMFLTLGLLVFPTEIVSIAGPGLLIALSLILIGRPFSIFAGLMFSRFDLRSKLLVSWTGLRGAVPIILATFPLVAGLQHAELFFSIVFFVVVTSVIIQGPTIPYIARWLKKDMPYEEKMRYPIEFDSSADTKKALKEVELESGDFAVGKKIYELELPDDMLITLINREGQLFIPGGTSELKENDKLLILTTKESMSTILNIFK